VVIGITHGIVVGGVMPYDGVTGGLSVIHTGRMYVKESSDFVHGDGGPPSVTIFIMVRGVVGIVTIIGGRIIVTPFAILTSLVRIRHGYGIHNIRDINTPSGVSNMVKTTAISTMHTTTIGAMDVRHQQVIVVDSGMSIQRLLRLNRITIGSVSLTSRMIVLGS